jgi:hypothetical protein
MGRSTGTLLAATSLLAVVIGGSMSGCSGGSETDGTTATGAGAGMKAHVDPETGELRDTPAAGTEPVSGGDVLPPTRIKGAPPLSAGAQGMKAYVDPETGQLRDSPAPGTEPVEGGDVLPPAKMVDRDED